MLLLKVILRLGTALASVSKASCSISPRTVAKTELIAICLHPKLLNSFAALISSSGSSWEISLPSISYPPFTSLDEPPIPSMSDFGQSVKGRIELPDGKQRRINPVLARFTRCTSAFTKCVVPTIKTSTFEGFVLASVKAPLIEFSTPVKMSGVVGHLVPPKYFFPSMTTASVLVPPTSTPTLIIFLLQL